MKSEAVGGADAIRTPFEAVAGAAQLNLVVSPGAGRVEGVVRDGPDTLVSGATVTLWPKTPWHGIVNGGMRAVGTDPRGRYEFTDLAPGEYYVAAWQEIDPTLVRSPEFAARFAERASEVTVGEAAGASVEIGLISREAFAEEIEKLP